MLFFLMEFLTATWGYKIPFVFTYYSTRMILAALTGFFFVILLGPSYINKLYQFKIGQTIRKEDCPLLGQLHEKKKETPTMGGLLILCSMCVAMFLWMDLKSVFTLILLVTTISLGALGAYDDYLKLKYKNTAGLSGKKKLLIQLLVSGCLALYLLHPPISNLVHVGDWFAPPVIKEQLSSKHTQENSVNSINAAHNILSLKEYASRIYIPFFKDHLLSFSGLSVIFSGLFIMFVVTGTSNAVNLTDGLDGLAAGSLILVASSIAFVAFISNHITIASYLNILYVEDSGEIAIYLSAFVGSCLAFLWFNGYPAQMFMGDTGSLALGGIIGVSCVLLKREFLLGIVGGVFVAEAMSVIIQVASYQLRNKKRVFLCAPLHHHFEYKGWPETKVVMRFWIIGLLLAIIGIASLKFQ